MEQAVTDPGPADGSTTPMPTKSWWRNPWFWVSLGALVVLVILIIVLSSGGNGYPQY
jgi:hypothetical protein